MMVRPNTKEDLLFHIRYIEAEIEREDNQFRKAELTRELNALRTELNTLLNTR